MIDQNDLIQIVNTAIVKTKDKDIDLNFEQKLSQLGNSRAMKALGAAIAQLSSSANLSNDEAASEIINLIRELDKIWDQYLFLEGMTLLKKSLQTPTQIEQNL